MRCGHEHAERAGAEHAWCAGCGILGKIRDRGPHTRPLPAHLAASYDELGLHVEWRPHSLELHARRLQRLVDQGGAGRRVQFWDPIRGAVTGRVPAVVCVGCGDIVLCSLGMNARGRCGSCAQTERRL